MISLVDELNKNQEVNGILVQLPLPKHINDINILDKVDPTKDVDGFHPEHMGKIGMRGREPNFVPCTAKVLLFKVVVVIIIIIIFLMILVLRFINFESELSPL